MSSTGINNETSDINVWTSTLTILLVLFCLYLIYMKIKLFLINKEKQRITKKYNKWINKKWIHITFPVKYKKYKVQPKS